MWFNQCSKIGLNQVIFVTQMNEDEKSIEEHGWMWCLMLQKRWRCIAVLTGLFMTFDLHHSESEMTGSRQYFSQFWLIIIIIFWDYVFQCTDSEHSCKDWPVTEIATLTLQQGKQSFREMLRGRFNPWVTGIEAAQDATQWSGGQINLDWDAFQGLCNDSAGKAGKPCLIT